MKKEIVTYKTPKSPISELFRTLRTNLQFMVSNKELKTLLITSTIPEEGKTWIASNLAVTFAQAGNKVVLIDADMRKGRQFSMFGVAPKPGLSNFLSGIDIGDRDDDAIKYIQETEVENLYVISAGSIPPNPSELLMAKKMEKMIEELKRVCDIMIFDGTPSALVTDSIILSKMVDSTVIVASYKETKKEDLKEMKRKIENVGGKIAGVVFNKAPISEKEYMKSYYYGNTNNMSVITRIPDFKSTSKDILKQHKTNNIIDN